ncbi:MAG: glycosyltransferase family 39 protein [Ginsengibacter sp.]
MKIKNNSILKNPYVLFAPFLILYVSIVLVFPTTGMQGDEPRYIMFAQNLIRGFYSPPPPDINLWNGPGYPILLIPFVALHLPLLCITLLNSILYYLSVVILFKTLRRIISFRKSIIICLFWACYYNSFQDMVSILPETLSSFLVSLLSLYLVKSFDANNKSLKTAILSGFIMGFLVLTKIIFGYIILLMLIGTGAIMIIKRKIFNYRIASIILITALGTNIPYLIYTHHLTGKILYWGDSGGMSLYWMTSPNNNEYGDWFIEPGSLESPDQSPNSFEKNKMPTLMDSVISNHKKDFEEINKYKGIERDNMYKKIAISNIRNHPLKYIKNCISNTGRLFFSTPFSYTLQSNNNLIRLPLGGLMILLIAFSLIPTILNWNRILFSIRFILFFVFLYLSLTILVSTYTRMLTVIVPMLLLWFAYIIPKSLKIKWRI